MLTLCLIVACSFALTACSNEEHHEEHHISIARNDYFEISTSVSTAKSEEKVTISYTKKENFVGKPGYELKFIVATNDNNKTIVVNYDESGNYYFIMPDCDVSIFAEYLPIQYTITYDLNGGENDANNPTTYTVDSNDIIISQPVRSGFYFWGWTINDDSQIVRNYTIPSGTTGNITLKANWKIRVINYDNYKHLEKPTYTGEEFSVSASDFIDAIHENIDQFVEISGDTKATNAGIYNVTLSLKDKVNYCWYDETTEDKTATWEIVKAELIVYRPSSIRYSGEEISVTSENFFAYNKHANLVDITGTTSATNAGTYNVTLSLKDKANTTWKDGTTEDKIVTWEIQKRIIYLQSYKWETYSGEELSAYNVIVADSHAVDFVNITGTASATNVGVYEITLSLKDKENTIWSDGTTEDKNATWEIKTRKIATLDQFETIYTGDEIVLKNTYFIANINDSKFITLLGRTNATEVGTYDVILSLIDKTNTTWEDGTTEDKTISWEIKTPSKVTLKNEKTEKVFTGSEISVTSKDFVKFSPIAVEITGTTSATNVGTYNVTLSLKDKANTTWEDGTIEDKNVTWEIVKAKLTVTRYTPLYSGEEKVVTSVNLVAEDEYADFVTVSGQTSATEPGAYTVTLSLNDKINMTWSDGTTDDKTVKWKIQRLDWKNNVAVSAFVKKIYTGEEITVTSADFILAEEYADYITISGQTSGTEKGTYTVTISLADKENMTWDDDTTEDKTVQWVIAD